MVKYSICVTHYNDRPSLEKSLNSILDQIDADFEVVLVDSQSNDGSLDILKEYAKANKIKLLVAKCSRGRGRQIAFENSSGSYVIANMDMDNTYQIRLKELMTLYEKTARDMILLVTSSTDPDEKWNQNITVGPRSLIAQLGGWRDLDAWEDWDLWNRAAKVNKFAWAAFPIVSKIAPHPERHSLLGRISTRYWAYKNGLRAGRRLFYPGEKRSVIQRAIYWSAQVAVLFSKKYGESGRDEFNPHSKGSMMILVGSDQLGTQGESKPLEAASRQRA